MAVITEKADSNRFYYGWVIVATVGLASFSQAAGFFPVLGVLLKPMTAEFGWSRTVFTAATTLGTLAGALAALFVGGIVDRVGGRWLLTAALFLLGLTYVLMAFMQDLWQFYALQIFGRMLTMGVISLALRVIIPKWFIARRGPAVAIAGMGGMLGNTLTPLYVQAVVGMADWRTATFVAGAAIWAVSVIPVALFLRRQPEDMGLLPDGVRDPAATTRPTDAAPAGIVEEGPTPCARCCVRATSTG
jgi:sugar phosphate permease